MIDLYVIDPRRFLTDFLEADFRKNANGILQSRWGTLEPKPVAPAFTGLVATSENPSAPPADPIARPTLSWSWVDYVEDWERRSADIPGRSSESSSAQRER